MANHLRPSGAPVGGVKFAAVSYVELAAEDGFAALVESIGKVDVKSWPPNAQCAFYINAYNILCAEHVCRTIMLSRIFLWYAGDFESRGGSPTYAARYAPPGAAKDALATASPGYFAYDWSLNTQ